MQQHHYQPGKASTVLEANDTLDDDKLRLTPRWGYAEKGISEIILMEEGDERPRVMRQLFTTKRPRKTILLLLGLLSGWAMEMFFLLHLSELGQVSWLLL